MLEEWGPNGADSKNNGSDIEKIKNGHNIDSEGVLGSVLLSAKLSDHLGARVSGRGGIVDVFFVCDGDVNKGTRIKYKFSQVCVCMYVCVVDVFYVCDGDVNEGSRIKYMFSQVCVYVCMCVCCENGFVVCDGIVNKGTRIKYMFSQVCVYVCVCVVKLVLLCVMEM